MTTQPLDQSEHEQCLDDVLTVYMKAVDAGKAPDRELLFEQHPELAGELREFFAGQDRLDLFAAPLRPVVQAARQDAIETRVTDQTPYTQDECLAQLLPESVGEYVIVDEIAHGGMGIVYKARHNKLRRLVALKVLLAGPFARVTDLQRFRSETEMVASLDHPNIVPIYDVAEHDRQPYFSMKLIEGGSLAMHADRFQRDPRAAAQLLVSLAGAVHHAHQRGILHRDLKPSNVLLDHEGQPYLTDFGLARWAQEDTGVSNSGAILGTPSYMAPEQALGQRQLLTTSSDVYGLGAVLYFLLTGKPPFRGETPLKTLQQVLEQEPMNPSFGNPQLPRDLETICLHCLAKDPTKRYATAQELADDLTRFLEGVPIRARVTSSLERAQKWMRRKPAQAALLAVSLLALVAFAIGGGVYEHRLRGAWSRAEANATEAHREKTRADSNYKQARETLVRILQKTKDSDVGSVPKLNELARRQSEEAIAFYLKIAEQTGDNPEILQDSAWARRDAAMLQYALGMKSEAVSNLQQASAQFADLSAKYPEKPAYLFGKIGCLNALAGIAPTDAEFGRTMEVVLSDSEKLVQENSQDILYRLGLATACNQMAIWRTRQNRLEEAFDLYARAMALREEVQQRVPNDREIRLNIAETSLNFSQLAYRCGKRDQGKQLHDRAETELTNLLAEKPGDLPTATALAGLRVNWAYVLREEHDTNGAIAGLSKNIEEMGSLLRQEPNALEVRARLFASHGLRGELYTDQHRFLEAAFDAEKCLLFAPEANLEFQHLMLAMAYARAGQHANAIREVKTVAAQLTDKSPASYRVHLASVCGLSAAAAQQDKQLSESARTATAAECIQIGIQQMREVKKTLSYFDWLLEMPGMISNPDLAPLRTSPQWIELLKP